MNLLQISYNITHLTLGVLLHYFRKLQKKILQIFSRYGKNANRLHFTYTDFKSTTRV